MPRNDPQQSVGNQLAQALREKGVSQKELARRLAGTKDLKKIEAKRRWLAKIMEGKIQRPGMIPIERALKLPPGYFRLPTPEQVRLRADRQEELAAQVAQLRREFDAFVKAATERQAAQEVVPEQAKQQSGRRSTARQAKKSP